MKKRMVLPPQQPIFDWNDLPPLVRNVNFQGIPKQHSSVLFSAFEFPSDMTYA